MPRPVLHVQERLHVQLNLHHAAALPPPAVEQHVAVPAVRLIFMDYIIYPAVLQYNR